MGFLHVVLPQEGERIQLSEHGRLNVPDNPIIPFIEGDGIGVDISPVMRRVVDSAVAKEYGGNRKIFWMETFAGEKALDVYGPDEWLPAETLDVMREFLVGIKGPMTTPVGGWDSLTQCGIAPTIGFVCVSQAYPVVKRSAEPRRCSTEDQYGHISGKHRRHLCRS